MTSLSTLPLSKKPREKMFNQEVDISLEEIIAILIGSGSAGVDALMVGNAVATKLVAKQFSNQDLISIKGVGKAKVAIIQAALKLNGSLEQRINTGHLSNPQKVAEACHDLVELSQEHLVVFYLTVRNKSLARETVSIGTATASLVHPREVFRPAINHNASHIVLAHNHPSGDCTASEADREVTQLISRAGKLIGIELLDHVICSKDGFFSLKEKAPDLFFDHNF